MFIGTFVAQPLILNLLSSACIFVMGMVEKEFFIQQEIKPLVWYRY